GGDGVCPHPPALLRRRRSEGRRGRQRRALVRGADLSPPPGGLWRHRRKRGRRPTAAILPRPPLVFVTAELASLRRVAVPLHAVLVVIRGRAAAREPELVARLSFAGFPLRARRPQQDLGGPRVAVPGQAAGGRAPARDASRADGGVGARGVEPRKHCGGGRPHPTRPPGGGFFPPVAPPRGSAPPLQEK